MVSLVSLIFRELIFWCLFGCRCLQRDLRHSRPNSCGVHPTEAPDNRQPSAASNGRGELDQCGRPILGLCSSSHRQNQILILRWHVLVFVLWLCLRPLQRSLLRQRVPAFSLLYRLQLLLIELNGPTPECWGWYIWWIFGSYVPWIVFMYRWIVILRMVSSYESGLLTEGHGDNYTCSEIHFQPPRFVRCADNVGNRFWWSEVVISPHWGVRLFKFPSSSSWDMSQENRPGFRDG